MAETMTAEQQQMYNWMRSQEPAPSITDALTGATFVEQAAEAGGDTLEAFDRLLAETRAAMMVKPEAFDYAVQSGQLDVLIASSSPDFTDPDAEFSVTPVSQLAENDEELYAAMNELTARGYRTETVNLEVFASQDYADIESADDLDLAA